MEKQEEGASVMEKIAISCIVPVYNVEEYVPHVVEGLIKQTLKNIEIIFVDDASTDRSAEILETYQNKYKNIKVYKNSENLGAGETRNYGLRMAQGEFVIFLDADDIFSEKLLEKLYHQALSYQADCVIYYTGHFTNGEEDMTVPDRRGKNIINVNSYPLLEEPEKNPAIFEIITNSPYDKLVRREVLIKNEIQCSRYPRTNDMYYSYASVLCSPRVVYLDEDLYFQRRNRAGSITTVYAGRTYILQVLEEIYLLEKKRNMTLELEEKFWRFALHRIYETAYDMNETNRQIFMELGNKILKEYFELFYTKTVHSNSSLIGILVQKLKKRDFSVKYEDILYQYQINNMSRKYQKKGFWKVKISSSFMAALKKKGKYMDYIIYDEDMDAKKMKLIAKSWMANKAKNNTDYKSG